MSIPAGNITASAKARRLTVRRSRAFFPVKAIPFTAMLPQTLHAGTMAQKIGTANAHAQIRHGQ